jgi:hypothetical protein
VNRGKRKGLGQRPRSPYRLSPVRITKGSLERPPAFPLERAPLLGHLLLVRAARSHRSLEPRQIPLLQIVKSALICETGATLMPSAGTESMATRAEP